MATTAKGILPQQAGTSSAGSKGSKGRRPLTKAHKAKLAAALADWRAALTDEDKAALRERNAATHKERWNNLSERERRDRLAGVKAWQRQQKAAKRAAAKAASKPAPKANPTGKGAKASSPASVGESQPRARGRKAAAK